jgi:hypothetical protein
MNEKTLQELRYLTPDLGVKVCALILLHEANNVPTKLSSLMDTLYPPQCFSTPDAARQAQNESLVYLAEMMDLGWLNGLDMNSCFTLTAEGMAVAANIREYYEA